jgi:type VI secretion system protein VasG
MVAVDLRSLVAKINDPCRRALESAAGYTLSQTQYNVEIEHWLLKLLDVPNSDISLILRRFEIDAGRVAAELTSAIDKLKKGNARGPSLSPELVSLAREAWLVASLEGGARLIRSGHILVALLADDSLARNVRDGQPQLRQISAETLRKDFASICQASSEEASAASVASGEAQAAPISGSAQGLDQFTIDLTERARRGAIDPVLGRDAEIRQVIDILMRRRQNNPILTGEAGVGKTAVVEGLALAIVKEQVPPPLRSVTLRTLDLGLLQAGAGVRGEFENRLKSVIEEVRASSRPIILFIDEAHTLVGAGGQAGQSDAANLMKPALARGDLRTIAATTWAEYKKYFERDAALTRRFQVVRVEEPTEEVAIDMLGGLLPTLEAHHKVSILREALVDAVRLSRRYIPARQLPDKAVSVLDTACARVAISRSATPPAIEDRQRQIEILNSDIRVLEREQHTGTDHQSDLAALRAHKAKAEAELAGLEERWQRERGLAEEIGSLRERLTAPPPADGGDTADVETARARLAEVERKLRELQGETPLLFTRVDGQVVAEVVSGWTGIPLGRMLGDEIRAVLSLRDRMGERVIGQPQALRAVAEAIQTSRAQLTDPRKPIGVFLMVGTSGVGKTETALSLAELLYGGEQNLTVINMSEFKEEHKVSMLLGAPPGYVGYGEGGVLTEAVRRRPYSVVLLDEMEKAHPGVQDIFYQIFDKGSARDGEGRDIDFKNTVIIMTSNAGSDLIAKLCADPETAPDAAGLAEALRPELLKIFKPAFLGRVTLVPYFPLSDQIIRSIVELQLGRIAKRIADNYRATFDYAPALVDVITSRCHEAESGARNVEQILARGLLPELSARFLDRMAAGETIKSVHVTAGDGDTLSFQFDEAANS